VFTWNLKEVNVNEMEKKAEEFREGVRKQAGGGPRNRYTAELRELARSYWKKRKAEGATLAAAAKELGIHAKSLHQWSKGRGRARQFHPVELIAEEQAGPRRGSSLVLHGPGGVRVEGLTVESLAALLRRLR
jgi:transposase